MTRPLTLAAAMEAGITAAALTGCAFAPADRPTSMTTGEWVPYHSYESRYSYAPDGAYRPYYSSRQAFMEEAGRRWDAIERDSQTLTRDSQTLTPYEAERAYGHPYANEWRSSPYYPGGGSPGATQDSNPNDFATGIYNPKP